MLSPRGATILGTASARNHEYIRSLGAGVPIDYNAVDFRDAVRKACPAGAAVALDCVGGGVLAHTAEVLDAGGRLVSIVDPSGIERLKHQGVDAAYVFVEPRGDELAEIARMIEAGDLTTRIAASFPLENAAKAHEISKSGHVRGKLVLTVR